MFVDTPWALFQVWVLPTKWHFWRRRGGDPSGFACGPLQVRWYLPIGSNKGRQGGWGVSFGPKGWAK